MRPGVHNADLVGKRERLLLIVRDVDERDAELALQALELDLHLLAQLQIERGQRLVQQQYVRPVHEGARQRDTLLLAPAQLRRIAAAHLGKVDEVEKLVDQLLHFRFGHLLATQAEGYVVEDLQMRKECIALEHHVDRPAVRRRVRVVFALEQDRALVGDFKAGDDSQQRALAAPARTEQRDELALFDDEGNVVHGGNVVESLRHVPRANDAVPVVHRPTSRGTCGSLTWRLPCSSARSRLRGCRESRCRRRAADS
jgi:hypothetical protein